MKEQRIGKEIETLVGAGHEVSVVELTSPDGTASPSSNLYQLVSINLVSRFLPKNLFFWLFKYLEMTLRLLMVGSALKPDLVHCVDRLPLPAAYGIAKMNRIPFLYDAQEIHSGVNSAANKPKWLWLALERFLAQRAVRIFVTDHFRLDITAQILCVDKKKFFTLMSYPRVSALTKMGRSLRAECPFSDGHIAVYAGGIYPNRHIEEIIGALAYLPTSYNVVLVGFVDEWYQESLMQLARQLDVGNRMVILPPVHWTELPVYVSSADCAFAFYQKNSLNNLYASPSKLFDALLAGLPVISTDNPLAVEILRTHDAGVCIDTVCSEAVARAVVEVVSHADSAGRKTRLAALAGTKFSWESQADSLVHVYAEIESERSVQA